MIDDFIAMYKFKIYLKFDASYILSIILAIFFNKIK